MPELFDVELPAPADRALDYLDTAHWDRAFVTSVAARRPDAVGSAAIQRLRDLSAAEADLAEKALEVALQVAVDPSHPLNAKHLHERLMGLPLADRDTSWSRQTYFAFDEEGPLKRILRWAARGPHLDCPEEVAELAVLTLAWTMTSPHRRLRDYATKVLVVMLAPRPGDGASAVAAISWGRRPLRPRTPCGDRLCGDPHGRRGRASRFDEVGRGATSVRPRGSADPESRGARRRTRCSRVVRAPRPVDVRGPCRGVAAIWQPRTRGAEE